MHFYQRPPYTATERHERRLALVRCTVGFTLMLLVCALLSLALPSCSMRPPEPTHEQLAERMAPAASEPASSVATYPNAEGYEVVVSPADTVKAAATGWQKQ